MSKLFSPFAEAIARASGKPLTFAVSVVLIVVWALSGPLFGFSDTWQLVINTGTTIVTFLMVFLIQNTQNRDGAAIQAKLDELIRVSAAQDRYIGTRRSTSSAKNARPAPPAIRPSGKRTTPPPRRPSGRPREPDRAAPVPAPGSPWPFVPDGEALCRKN